MANFSYDKHQTARDQLGLFFAERRTEMGHSCKALANFVGISENTMQRIEAGKFDFDISLLFKICEALEIKPYFLPKEKADWFEGVFSDDDDVEIKTPDLEDAWAMSVVHSKTFEVPDNDAIAALSPGSLIKVKAAGERFWCIIIEVKDGGFVGKVDNELVSDSHGLKLGDLIFIKPNNIYQIYKGD